MRICNYINNSLCKEFISLSIRASSLPIPTTSSSRASQRRLRTETQGLLKFEKTISERELERVPIEEILCNLESFEIEEFKNYLPFFMQIIANETSQTFGYHGASQEVRLFQDALKIIFEEKLGIQIPENFYFLRIPGDEFAHQTENVKKDFFDSQPHLDADLSAYALDYFVLNRLNKEHGLSLKASDFSPKALAEVERLMITIIKRKRLNPFDQTRTLVSPFSQLGEEISQLSELDSEEVINNLHSLAVDSEIEPYALYGVLEEVFGVRNPFQKGDWDSYFDCTHRWSEFCGYFYDVTPESSAKVLSMVGPLFKGLDIGGESCITPFLENIGYEFLNESRIKHHLDRFCVLLGMEEGTGIKLMETGRKILARQEDEDQKGVIFQFFDESSGHVADQITYLSAECGIPFHRSDRIDTSAYLDGRYRIDGIIEIRMIMDNASCLNPNGPVRMIRYDTLPEGMGAEILADMKKIISQANVDPAKVQAYQEKLNGYWS